MAATDSLSWPCRTPSLDLRPSVTADAAALAAYRGLPEVVRYLGHDRLDRQGVLAMLKQDRVDPARPVLRVSAIERASGEVVGDGVLGRRHAGAVVGMREEPAVHLAEGWLGYVIRPASAGRGYGTELASALLEIGFAGFGLRRVVAHVFSEHTASCRVMAKVGMRLEARFRSCVLGRDGRWLDDDSYALLREEWLGGAAPDAPGPTLSA